MENIPIAQTNVAKELDRIAQTLDRPEAAQMYNSLVAIAEDALYKTTLAAGFVEVPDDSVRQIRRLEEWVNYFAQEEKEYI